MLAQFGNARFYIILVADIVIFVLAFIGAYLLRFDFSLSPFYWSQIAKLLPLLLSCKITIFFLFGLYQGMWRYTTINDLWRLAQACILSTTVFIGGALFFLGAANFPHSVFLLDGSLTFIMCCELRMGIRIFYIIRSGSYNGQGLFNLFGPAKPQHAGKSFLIVGAGGAGEKIYREIRDNPRLNCDVVGFLDDDRSKWGRSLHRLRVLGGVELLPKLMEVRKIDEVLIAIPAATGDQMRRIIEICKSCGARFRTLPEIGAIIDGKVSIRSLRDVKYEDLLRRPPVSLDTAEISKYLNGKRVLITGAGGSIGSELCRQIIRFDPKEVILVDVSEEHLFAMQMELQHELKFSRYHCILGQVQDLTLMSQVFREYQPQHIFHAAAYKHVPMLEKNPWQAISNNVLGSQVVMALALNFGVESFVLVSTDKAVRPTSVMGVSKRLTELIMQSLQGDGTRFMAVRFGNVVGSSGSALPLFRRQLEKGGPITVTHPEVTRYFMTIPEAAQLILQTGGLGKGGEIFVLEMGTPVKIAKMAEELVRLSGKEPGKDIQIIYTGLREGEKLYEELITKDENIMPTRHEKIMVLRSNGWGGKRNKNEFSQWLNKNLDDLYRISNNHDGDGIKDKLSEILPEYKRHNAKCVLVAKDHAGGVGAPGITGNQLSLSTTTNLSSTVNIHTTSLIKVK